MSIKPASALIKSTRRSQMMRQIADNNVGKFTGWFLERGKKSPVAIIACAKFLATIMPDRDITESTVRNFICSARKVLENKKGMSIWNVSGKGYRIATENEKAIFLVRHAHKTIKHAERANRLYVITDRKLIPGAVEKVFGSKAAAQRQLAGYSKSLGMICNPKLLLTNGKG